MKQYQTLPNKCLLMFSNVFGKLEEISMYFPPNYQKQWRNAREKSSGILISNMCNCCWMSPSPPKTTQASLVVQKKRHMYGTYNCLLKELQSSNKPSYKNFLRMDKAAFEEFLQKVEPLIQKRDTHLRMSIPPGERLALTHRYLASPILRNR